MVKIELTNRLNKKTLRESNLELLRLICMLFIVIHHILIHALHQVLGYDLVDLSKYTIISTLLDGFLYVAVDSFILISGYFSIKLKPDKLIHLYVLSACYGAMFYFLHLYIDGQSIGKTLFPNSIFVISNTQDLWFIQSYFYLCLFSPLLNRSIEYFKKKEHLIAIFSLTILNVYFGFVWHNPVNSDGYNVMNFIYLYVIGQYIKRHISIDLIIKFRNKLTFSYVLLSFLIGMLVLFSNYLSKGKESTIILWTYNNPIVIMSSIIFFCIFLTFSFKSKAINWLATSTLSVYLIHENSFIRHHIYNFIGRICNYPIIINHIIFTYIVVFIFALLLMFICIFFDKVFQKIIKPIESLLAFVWSKIEIRFANIVN